MPPVSYGYPWNENDLGVAEKFLLELPERLAESNVGGVCKKDSANSQIRVVGIDHIVVMVCVARLINEESVPSRRLRRIGGSHSSLKVGQTSRCFGSGIWT